MATAPRTISELVFPRPHSQAGAIGRDVGLVLIGAAFVAAAAQITIHLPFVPITAQTFAVLVTGAALGSVRGGLALLSYVAAGAAGLPIYAEHKFGMVTLLGPTGGYLIGFIVAAALVGYLAEHGWDRTPWMTAAAMVLGNLAIYAFGVAWLAHVIGSFQSALTYGLYPFLLGDAIKLAVAVIALPLAHVVLGRRSPQI